MKKFAIIYDSSSDLDKDLREKYGLEDYIHGMFYYPDGRESRCDLDWGEMTPEEFYTSMKGKKVLYKTGSPTYGETYDTFEKYLSQGIDVLSISMSSALSVTYQNCVNAANDINQKYTNNKVICVDSLRYSKAFGLLVILAAIKRDEGATIEETTEYLNQIKYNVHQMGPMDDLFFLVKTGRISGAKAFFGTLLGVNPMADFNRKGMSEVLTKVKGKKTAFDVTLKYMEKTIINPEEQIIFVTHSNREEHAKLLASMIKEKFNPKEIIISTVGMGCGASIGPGLCVAFYLGTPISENFENEKAIISEITGK